MAYIDTKYLFECETCRHHRSGKCDTWCEIGEAYMPLMSKIPTADVAEVKHAKYAYAEDRWCRCTNCGYHPTFSLNGMNAKYCPNCGAKMDGGKI